MTQVYSKVGEQSLGSTPKVMTVLPGQDVIGRLMEEARGLGQRTRPGKER